jgi:hypothetical protein
MRKLLIPLLLLSLTTGCATTDYRVNGIEPKRDNTMTILGTVALIGLAASLGGPHKGKEACKSYVSGPTGNSVITTYQTKCP